MHFANNFPTLNIRLAKLSKHFLQWKIIAYFPRYMWYYNCNNWIWPNKLQRSIFYPFHKIIKQTLIRGVYFLVYLISRLRRCSGFEIILELKLFFRRMHFDVASHKAHCFNTKPPTSIPIPKCIGAIFFCCHCFVQLYKYWIFYV